MPQLVDVGDPLKAVTADEDGHNDETDLGELELLLPLGPGPAGQTPGLLLLLNLFEI